MGMGLAFALVDQNFENHYALHMENWVHRANTDILLGLAPLSTCGMDVSSQRFFCSFFLLFCGKSEKWCERQGVSCLLVCSRRIQLD